MASGSTTVHGLPYPLSTDAPSVHSDIQALAQALANSLTAPVSAGTSQTLSDGQLAVSTASPITLTLPTAAVNVKCGAFAKVATAANPVTVSAPGGALIYGVGLNGVSSLTLGVVGAFVILQSDGTNWFIVGGERDTGWAGLAGAGGISQATGYYNIAYRIRGGRVGLRGAIQNTSGATFNSGSTLLNGAPAPVSGVAMMGLNPGGGTQSYSIAASSSSIVSVGALQISQIAVFDGLNYSLA